MAAITICSDFGAQKNKVSHCFHCFPIYLPWSYGTGCGTGSNELIQSNIGRLILFKKKKKVSTRTHWVTQESYSTLCNILYQKRAWKRRYIHLRASESSCCRSKKKKKERKHPQPYHSTTYCNSNWGMKVQNRNQKGWLLPSDHGDPDGVTSLEPELEGLKLEGTQAWRGSMQRSWEHMAGNVVPRWTWVASSPLHEPPVSRCRWNLLQRNQAYITQELVEPLGWNRFARSPGQPMSPRLGFLPSASILRVTPPTVDSTLCRVVFQKTGMYPGDTG